MTTQEYNEMRWKSLAKEYHITVKKAKKEYPPIKIAGWAKAIAKG